MLKKNRPLLITFILLALFVCLCAVVLSLSGLGLYYFSRHVSVANTPTNIVYSKSTPTRTALNPTATPSSSIQVNGSATPLAPAGTNSVKVTALPNPTLPADVSQQMDQIEAQVESYRELKSNTSVDRSLLTTDQLKDKVLSDFLQDYTQDDAKKDVTILNAFGLLPADFDYYTFQKNFLVEQVAGYYDNITKKMYVVSDQGFDGLARMTYAHEYTHFLQDQNFDIENGLGYSDKNCLENSEKCAAVQALIEGDAILSEEYWFYNFATPLDKQQVQSFQKTYTSPVFDSSPEFFQEDSMFPYTQGLDFVSTLYSSGGWAAINKAFRNPPVSTAQILHPNLYPNQKPVKVTLPGLAKTLGSGWSSYDSGVIGEWYSYLILEAGYDSNTRLDKTTAESATAGWQGDSYAIYTDSQNKDLVLAATWQWDTTADSNQFEQAFLKYGNTRWGKATTSTDTVTEWDSSTSSVIFSTKGQSTTWILAPDKATAAKIASALAH